MISLKKEVKKRYFRCNKPVVFKPFHLTEPLELEGAFMEPLNVESVFVEPHSTYILRRIFLKIPFKVLLPSMQKGAFSIRKLFSFARHYRLNFKKCCKINLLYIFKTEHTLIQHYDVPESC
ncbi:UNVERIFIED_CONTAM: hypothetical protein NCL1_43249 [Trichonephila clavipes]